MENFMEVVKMNKGKIIKRVLLIGGGILGIVLVAKALTKKEDEIEESLDGDEFDTDEDSGSDSE